MNDSPTEPLVERLASARIPTQHGVFVAHGYRSLADGIEHIAYTTLDFDPAAIPLVRVHSECLTGDIFGSLRCDCGSQLDRAMARIHEVGNGAVVYLRGHEGRGIGLGNKLEAYALQDAGMDTVDANLALGFEADARDYGVGADILADLGIEQLRLLTNNPAKYEGLTRHGVRIVEQLPLAGETTDENRRYLETKRDRMGHLFQHQADS